MNTPKARGAARLRVVSKLRNDSGEGAAAEADRKAMKRLQHAEELQRHRDHEQSGDDREYALGRVQRAAEQRDRGSLLCAKYLPQRARQHAEKAVGGQPAGIIEEVPQRGCAAAATRIAAERAREAAAHADAMKTTGKARGKHNQVVGHDGSACLTRRSPVAEKSATTSVSRGKRPKRRIQW